MPPSQSFPTPRHLEPRVRQALETFRVVVVTGPRQAGKTTLVRRVLDGHGTFTRLDDETALQAARADPTSVAAYGPIPRAFDEVQRAGDPLIRAIKAVVDDNSIPGQYLLNGSADFLTVPTISESLAGRSVFMELWPFTQGELYDTPERFLKLLLSDPEALVGTQPGLASRDYLDRLCQGGFPEAANLEARARSTWFANYVRTVTQRDITELTGARRAQQLPKLLSLIAARTASEFVLSNVHADSGLGSRSTTDDYIAYLQMTYLAQFLPAWSRNLTRKITRHPKVHLTDTGLAAHLLGKNPTSLARPTDPARGPLLETFVFNELLRQAGWLGEEVRFFHLRDRDGAEVDLIVEANDGRVAAVEVKGSTTVSAQDARWIEWLSRRIPDEFVAGVVLYTGDRAFRLGDRIMAAPISHLWTADQ